MEIPSDAADRHAHPQRKAKAEAIQAQRRRRPVFARHAVRGALLAYGLSVSRKASHPRTRRLSRSDAPQARAGREEARSSIARDADPSSFRKATKRAARLASVNTFEAVAREWLENRGTSLSSGYRVRIQARLEADIFPQVGSRPIAAIDAPDLLEAFKRVEKRGAIEMAKRLRQVCGQVFRYAIATGRAKHDPSADLRGALKSPGRPRGHKAMRLDDVPAFLSAAAAYDGDPRTCLALRLVVLTFVRTTELRAAQWSEIEGLDGGKPLWRIPAERMKMKHEHIVPLAPQAVAVLGPPP